MVIDPSLLARHDTVIVDPERNDIGGGQTYHVRRELFIDRLPSCSKRLNRPSHLHEARSPGSALPQQESDSVLFEKHPLCRSVSHFQPAHSCTAFPRQKDRKQLSCVAKVRFGAEAKRGSSLVSTEATRIGECSGRQSWKTD